MSTEVFSKTWSSYEELKTLVNATRRDYSYVDQNGLVIDSVDQKENNFFVYLIPPTVGLISGHLLVKDIVSIPDWYRATRGLLIAEVYDYAPGSVVEIDGFLEFAGISLEMRYGSGPTGGLKGPIRIEGSWVYPRYLSGDNLAYMSVRSNRRICFKSITVQIEAEHLSSRKHTTNAVVVRNPVECVYRYWTFSEIDTPNEPVLDHHFELDDGPQEHGTSIGWTSEFGATDRKSVKVTFFPIPPESASVGVSLSVRKGLEVPANCLVMGIRMLQLKTIFNSYYKYSKSGIIIGPFYLHYYDNYATHRCNLSQSRSVTEPELSWVPLESRDLVDVNTTQPIGMGIPIGCINPVGAEGPIIGYLDDLEYEIFYTPLYLQVGFSTNCALYRRTSVVSLFSFTSSFISNHRHLDTEVSCFIDRCAIHSTSSDLFGYVDKEAATDSVLCTKVAIDHDTSSAIFGLFLYDHSTSSVLAGTLTTTFSCDSFIVFSKEKTHQVDLLLRKPAVVSHSSDTLVIRFVDKAFQTCSSICYVLDIDHQYSSFLCRRISRGFRTASSLKGDRTKKTFTCSYLSTYSRLGLYDLLPTIVKIRDADASGGSEDPILKKIVDSVDNQACDLKNFIVGLRDLLDFAKSPPQFLSLINVLLGHSAYEGWDEDLQRFLSSEAVAWHKQHGTVFSINKRLKYRAQDKYKILEVYKAKVEGEYGNYSLSQDGQHPFRAARIAVFRNM